MDDRTFAIMKSMMSAQADEMVQAVKEAVEAKPDIVGSEVLVLLEALAREAKEYATEAMADTEPDRDTCAKCGQPIENTSGHRERWLHSSDRSRGCRAATFHPKNGWNDDIPSSWTATPSTPRSSEQLRTPRH